MGNDKAYSKAYYAAHRDEERAKRKVWWAANRERMKAKRQEWLAAHPDYMKAYLAEYAKANSPKLVARAKAWAEAHPEEARAHSREVTRRRRAQKRGVGSVPYREADIFTRDGWTCRLCHNPIDPNLSRRDPFGASIDHIIPLSRGGADAPENVQAAHLDCNLRKHAKVA